ncbi:MAG: helix-turn-helix transcriptional regulator [Polyangiaceae bacterium]
MATKEPDVVALFLQHLLQERHEEDGAESERKFAERVGLTSSAVNQLRNHARGAGLKTVEKLAEHFGYSVDELREAAKEWAETGAAPTLKLHPELEVAVARNGPHWLPATVRYARVINRHWAHDRPLAEWINELERFDRAHRAAVEND